VQFIIILFVYFSQGFDPLIKINNGIDHTPSTLIALDITAELAQEMCFRNGDRWSLEFLGTL